MNAQLARLLLIRLSIALMGRLLTKKKTMNKKLLFAFVGALSLGTLNLRTQAAVASPSPSVALNLNAVNQYMFRGQLLGGFSIQPSVELGFGDTTVGLWASKPVTNRIAGISDPEFDFYGSYNFKIGDAMTLNPGFTWYVYPNLSNLDYKNTLEPNLALNYTVSGLKVTPKIYYDAMLKAATWEISGAYAYPLKDMGTELDFSATYGTYKGTDTVKNTDREVHSWGNYYSVGVTVPFAITTSSKLSVGWAYTQGWNAFTKVGTDHRAKNTAAVGRGVVTIGYSLSF